MNQKEIVSKLRALTEMQPPPLDMEEVGKMDRISDVYETGWGEAMSRVQALLEELDQSIQEGNKSERL